MLIFEILILFINKPSKHTFFLLVFTRKHILFIQMYIIKTLIVEICTTDNLIK